MDVRIEEPGEDGQLPTPLCPVCGEEIGAAPTVCPECDTPHHWDCWEYNGGCATYGCPHKTRKPKVRSRPEGAGAEEKIPDKIPFPRLKAGAFLGFFFVTPATAVLAILCEVMAIAFFGGGYAALGSMCLAGLVASVVWAALTAECYNLDILNRRISKSKLLLGKEIFEWGIAPLRTVRMLDIRPLSSYDPTLLRLVATLHTGQIIELCPPFRYGSEDYDEVKGLLEKIESGTTLTIGPGARPREGRRLAPRPLNPGRRLPSHRS